MSETLDPEAQVSKEDDDKRRVEDVPHLSDAHEPSLPTGA